jgi:adenylate kinase
MVKTRSGRVVLIMGPPNAGKDTQADLLARKLGGEHIGSGDLIRREADPRLMAIMARGDLVPPEDLRRLLSRAIEGVHIDLPIILAGTAKKPAEARWLFDYLPSIDRWLDKVIVITLTREQSIERSRVRSGARDDDHPAVQAERWDRYGQETMESLAYFRNCGILCEIDGTGTREQVAARIDSALQK